MTEKEKILILDFGGQYSHLIARRVRECHVYSEIVPYNITIQEIKKKNPKGIILTGGPASVYEKEAPKCSKEIFELGIPVLGICYGMQLMTYLLGGNVRKASQKEYGVVKINMEEKSLLLNNILEEERIFLMSHMDQVVTLPPQFVKTASTNSCAIAGMECPAKKLFGIQFHPEVNESIAGEKVMHQFLFIICQCKGDWQMASFIQDTVQQLQEKIGQKKVLLALSGGVDSSVAAAILSKAIGNQLICIFIDHGLLRKEEGNEVEKVMKEKLNCQFIRVNAQEQFLSQLQHVINPEEKRKIIGREFIYAFEKEAHLIGNINILAQGTIYPDVIESGKGKSAVIKSHHNVGGLPEKMNFQEIIEPLRYLLKDEVRKVGLALGLPESLIERQPFPGPGLAIRIIGEVTKEKVQILQEADAIFREEIFLAGLSKKVQQYFAILTNINTVGVMGDARTYEAVIALRAVETKDFMTGTWSKIPYEVLEKVSTRIVNEVTGINRVVYDITSKPPATIEWE